MKKELLIGMDLGTSSLKTDIYGPDGKMILSTGSEIKVQTHKEWEKAIITSLKGAKSIIEGKEKILSVDSTSGTILLVDEYGRPVHPPLMYYQQEPKWFELIKNYDSVKELRKKGVNLNPGSPIVKILKIRKEMPELFSKVRWIIPAATWVLYRLHTPENKRWEEIQTDYTNALKLGADITSPNPRWFKPLFEETGIPTELLPEITRCGDRIGEAESALALNAGLTNTAVYQGMTDGNASALASGALNVGELSLYSGTTTVVKYVSSEMIPNKFIYYHKHPLKGYLAGTATGLTGGFLTWFVKEVMNTDLEKALRLAEESKAEAKPLFFPPGDRSPFYDPNLPPALIGLWPEGERNYAVGKITKAIIAGITLMEYSLISLFEKKFNHKVKQVNLSGGGTRNKFWNRLRATIYGKEVVIYGERITIGTLIPALITSGIVEKIEVIKEKYLHVVDRVTPDNELAKEYYGIRDKYLNTWRKIADLSNF